jgi:hypothetical protein
MRFQPTDRPDRGHVGKKWTRYQLRSMQIILQATHGIVSGAPEFFKRAFGDTSEEFDTILLHPHDYIFNRDWYERRDAGQELHDYREVLATLTSEERADLVTLLSTCDPRDFHRLGAITANRRIQKVLPFYIPKPKDKLFDIWAKQRALQKDATDTLAEDERVEDAGLDQEIAVSAPPVSRKEPSRRPRAVA